MDELVSLRTATRDDLPALVAIINHWITESHVTFDFEPFTIEAREPWFEKFRAEGPHRLLVAERGQRVIGYATSTPLKPKAAYARSVETSVYAAPAWVGRGLGHRLLDELLQLLESDSEAHRAYAAIALPNPSSEKLHEKLGYAPIATLSEVGFKHGRYVDVRWFERGLS